MAATITSDWQYADFRSKDTVALRLAAANLHDAGGPKAALEEGSGDGRYYRLPANYLNDLAKIIKQYEAEISSAAASPAAANSRGPVCLRPRF